jgi:hypothetical protein
MMIVKLSSWFKSGSRCGGDLKAAVANLHLREGMPLNISVVDGQLVIRPIVAEYTLEDRDNYSGEST